MTEDANNPDRSSYLEQLKAGEFEFLDFGCSQGGSIAMGKAVFGAKRGLGIDISQSKVTQAIEAGHDAIVHDILDLPSEPLVRFCTMLHFLEHVADSKKVASYIRKACAVSRDFVFIRQPYFDADGYLFRNGLKLFWSDWHGHPNTMSSLEFYVNLRSMQDTGEISSFSIHLVDPIRSSAHKAVHPLASPIDQHEYDPSKHPQKPEEIVFEYPVYSEILVLINKSRGSHFEPFAKVKFACTIFDSSNARQ